MKNSGLFEIDIKYTHLMVSLNRQKYQLIASKEELRCKSLKSDLSVCFAPRKWLLSQNSSCVWNVFLERNPASCHIKSIEPGNKWYETASTNQWLFFVPNPIEILTICNEQVTQTSLSGTGLISLKPFCVLRDQTHELIAETTIETRDTEFFVPKFNESLVRISSDKVNASRFQLHDAHHYILIYILSMAVLILFVLHSSKSKSKHSGIRVKSISMPQLPIFTTDRHSSPTFSAGQNVQK